MFWRNLGLPVSSVKRGSTTGIRVFPTPPHGQHSPKSILLKVKKRKLFSMHDSHTMPSLQGCLDLSTLHFHAHLTATDGGQWRQYSCRCGRLTRHVWSLHGARPLETVGGNRASSMIDRNQVRRVGWGGMINAPCPSFSPIIYTSFAHAADTNVADIVLSVKYVQCMYSHL